MGRGRFLLGGFVGGYFPVDGGGAAVGFEVVVGVGKEEGNYGYGEKNK